MKPTCTTNEMEPRDALAATDQAATAATPAVPLQPFDPVQSLKRVNGNAKLLQSLINSFQEIAPALLDAMHQAITKAEPEKLYRAAHSLKTATATFGAEKARLLAQTLEQRGREGSLLAVEAVLAELGREVEELKVALAAWRPDRGLATQAISQGDSRAGASGHLPPVSGASAGKSILIIDDDAMSRSFAAQALCTQASEIIEACDGREGVEIALIRRPDLVICDIEMPGTNGYEVLAELRSDRRANHIPFIFITARDSRVDLRHGMELGADDYLTKPFTAEELQAAVAARWTKRAATAKEQAEKLAELTQSISLAFPHELRTPLNVILGAAELLLDHNQSSAPGEDNTSLIEMIRTAGERLRHLAENFMAHCGISGTSCGGASDAEKCLHRFDRPAQAIETQARASAQGAHRDADLSVVVEDVPVRTLATELAKIVHEIVSNACKFSPVGTPISVTSERIPGAYHLRVTDRGRGMTPEEINTVGAFRQFNRGYYEQQGVGLGLLIAKRLAERHGGRLEIQSRPGHGTTIQITLLTIES